ncbi:MAG: phytochelatin synthase family protein [Pseudomonadota bacterium]
MITRRTATGLITASALALFLHACATPQDTTAKQPPKITGSYVTLISDEGRKRIARSKHKVDYHSLMATFTMQETQTLCSVATAVTILNALPLNRPTDPKYDPYPFFTQANFFNADVNKIITRGRTLQIGQTLDESARIMALHGAKTKAYHAGDSSVEEFRRIAKAAMSDPTEFISINYRRNYVGQPPGAHFSPLAAYDEESDSFLILDVARYKFPPVWVPAADLFAAMDTIDTESNKTRGFIVVSAPST